MSPLLRAFLILTGVNMILSACPVTVEAAFREELFLRVGYLFFHYTVAPKKPKKEEKEKKEKPEKKPKKNRIAELYHAKGLYGFLKILREAAKVAGGAAKGIFHHLVFKRFRLELRVAGEDAAQTAVDYGYVCGAVSSATSLLLGYAKCGDCHINVIPDFRAEKSSVDFSMKARIAVFFLIQTLLRALIQSIQVIKTAKAADNSAGKNNSATESGVIHGGTSY
jgi:hypothetical protein